MFNKTKALNCLMTNSTAMAKNEKMRWPPRGIIIHSTGMNCPQLKRYIQPSKSDVNYPILIAELGKNKLHNDYNHTHRAYNFHFWIGKNKNNKVIVVQTLPLDIRAWKDNYIHICICEDNLNNFEYLSDCIKVLNEILIELCNSCDIPINQIFSHSEIGNTPDIDYWLKKYQLSIQIIKNNLTNK